MSRSGEGPLVGLTGADGFVGSAIREALQRAGYRIRTLPHSTALPMPNAPAEEFRRSLEGLHHLIHAGARNNAEKRLGYTAYEGPNVLLTAKLAQAAAEVLPGRMVFLSSIRAAAGPSWSGEVTDDMPAAPTCAYGRSKREAELACLDAFSPSPDRLTILRLAPVYGVGMKGNLGTLLRLADTPWPLPLEGLPGRRSLLALDAAVGAVLLSLSTREVVAEPAIASDLTPVSLTEIASAFRHGLSRPRRIVPFPAGLARWAAQSAGKIEAWKTLTAAQICRPQRLLASGWLVQAESLAGLEAVARQMR